MSMFSAATRSLATSVDLALLAQPTSAEAKQNTKCSAQHDGPLIE
jgi:hypothetical protein